MAALGYQFGSRSYYFPLRSTAHRSSSQIKDSPHSSAQQAGLILPDDIAKGAGTAKSNASSSKKTKSPANDEPVMSILVCGADRKAYLMTDGEVAFETAIIIVEPSQPLGTHLFSLIGPSEDRHTLKWTAFGMSGHPDAGVPADIWSNKDLRLAGGLGPTGKRRFGTARANSRHSS